MKNILIKIYILILGLFITTNSYGQLKEFMIQSYFYGAKPTNIGMEEFFRELKDKYKFNSIYLLQRSYSFDTGCTAAKKVGLALILDKSSLSSGYMIDENAAISDLIKYSNPKYGAIGYNILDEPDAKTTSRPHGYDRDKDADITKYIDNIPPFTNVIREFDESLLRFANLLPHYVFPDKDYREDYIQKYIDDSKPNLLSFDHYPIYDFNYYEKYNSGRDYFQSLYACALKSVENSIPFIYVLTPYKRHEDYDNATSGQTIYGKSIKEFYYVIYAALAYGAKIS